MCFLRFLVASIRFKLPKEILAFMLLAVFRTSCSVASKASDRISIDATSWSRGVVSDLLSMGSVDRESVTSSEPYEENWNLETSLDGLLRDFVGDTVGRGERSSESGEGGSRPTQQIKLLWLAIGRIAGYGHGWKDGNLRTPS